MSTRTSALSAASRFESGSIERGRWTGAARSPAPSPHAAAALPESCLGSAIEERVQSQHRAGLPDPLVDLARSAAAQLEPEGEVVADGQVRVKRVALEHHRDVTARAAARGSRPGLPTRSSRLVHLLEPRHDSKQSALPTSARPHEDRKRSFRNIEIDAAEDRVPAKRLRHAARGASDRSWAPARSTRCRLGRPSVRGRDGGRLGCSMASVMA